MLAVGLACLLGPIDLLLGPGQAQAQGTDDSAPVRVVEATGYLDPILVDFLTERIETAEADGVEVVVIVLDSPGALVSETELDALVLRVSKSPVPVAVWVGPTGSAVRGGAARLVVSAPISGIAPGSTIGRISDPIFGVAPEELRDGTVSADRALEAGYVDIDAPVVGELVAELDGREVAGRTLETASVIGEGDDRRQQPQNVTFAKLPFFTRLMHSVASPPVAYLLLAAGLVLVVFEFFTAGVGVAGGVGALCLALSAYGLGVLPTSPIGLALLVASIFAFSIDVQTGAPRFWTGLGVVAWIAGSVVLFDDGVRVGWLPLVAGTVGVVLMMLAGLPATVRSRFSTPTIGRGSMVGEMGEAVSDTDPDGVVRVRDALWPARTNRATPLRVGDRVRVVAVDGPRLEVEPEEGGAKDYRR